MVTMAHTYFLDSDCCGKKIQRLQTGMKRLVQAGIKLQDDPGTDAGQMRCTRTPGTRRWACLTALLLGLDLLFSFPLWHNPLHTSSMRCPCGMEVCETL